MSDTNNESPGLGDLLRVASRDAIGQTHGPIPAKVIAYTAATQRASVQPVVGVPNALGVYQPAPIMQGVPVAWGAVTWPLAPGSWVMLVPQDADISLWLQAASTGQAPPTPRTCSWSDCIAIPWGATPLSSPLPATAYSATGPVVAGSHVYLVSSAAADFMALASKVLSELQAVKNAFDNHIHGGGTLTNGGGAVTGVTDVPGTAPLGVPALPMPAPGSVASTKIHGE